MGAIAQQLYPGRARAGQKLLQEANKDILSDPRKLRIGMQLKVPQLPPVVSAQGTGSGLAGSGVAGAPPTGSSTPAVLGPNPVPEARPNPSGQTAQSSGSGREELYIVRAGDTLEGIAKKVYNNKDRWREIYEGNKDKMSSPTQLRVGVELRINQKPAAQEQAKPKESRKTLAEVSGPHVEVLPAARVDAPSETLSEMP